jgi:hypothetical protein
MTAQNPERGFLRHTVATLAYRGSKAIRGAPETFGDFRAGPTSRTPAEILGHIGDLLDWALSMASGAPKWNTSAVVGWDEQVTRFHAGLKSLDDYLASETSLEYPAERLFQGPIADALSHVGQINMLRRLAQAPVKGESYNRADIVAGRVGPDQIPPPPKYEFD